MNLVISHRYTIISPPTLKRSKNFMLTLENIESEIEKCAAKAELYQYKFQLDLTGSSCNGDPHMYIMINNQIFYDQKFSGQKSFIIDHALPKDDVCNIIVGLKHKTVNNTLIQNDLIVKDQFVRVDNLKINQISLKKNNLYFWDHAKFVKQDSKDIVSKTDGAYYSGEWMLSLPTPIFPHLSKYFNDNIKDYNVDKTSLDADKRAELLKVVYD